MEDPTPTPNPDGRFLPQVEQVLRKAGWFPGRVVAHSQLVKWACIESPFRWLGMDFPAPSKHIQSRLFPAAWRALREFGGLTVNQDIPSVPGHRCFFYIDPIEGRSRIGNEDWFIDEWCADGALFPLGGTKDFTFEITGRGQVISSEYNLCLGNSIEEALTNLIMGNAPQNLDVDQEKFLEASFLMGLIQKEF
jgi:hypothetical protein